MREKTRVGGPLGPEKIGTLRGPSPRKSDDEVPDDEDRTERGLGVLSTQTAESGPLLRQEDSDVRLGVGGDSIPFTPQDRTQPFRENTGVEKGTPRPNLRETSSGKRCWRIPRGNGYVVGLTGPTGVGRMGSDG